MNQSLYNVAITLIPGIGDKLIKQLIGYCGTAEAVFKEKRGKLLKIPGIGEKTINAIHASDVMHRAELIAKRTLDEKSQLLFYTDVDFPDRLKVIDDAPCLLYFKGTSNLNHSKIIALVGTRRATSYGQEITEQLIEDLAPHQPIIVSGLAYGIDICAHKASIKNNLETIGVMASGLNVIYPSVHKKQAQEMVERGGLLTEFFFDEKPEMHNFPSRNRIIAGMSDATIVVEAAHKGGALITADIANSYNKEVFAVPGDVNKTYSQGCNALIKDHRAVLLTSAKDIENELNWSSTSVKEKKNQLETQALTETEKKIVQVLFDKPITLDEISRKSQVAIHVLVAELLTLEFRGVVKSLPGSRYQLNN